jgi:DNA primase
MPNEEAMPTVEVERTWPPEVLDRLVQDNTYWVKRGISEDVLVSLRGGVATTGQLAARYVFAISNENDDIIGFTGRSLINAKPSHKHIGKVSTWIWGGLEEIRETRQAVLVEGVGCRLALATHGVPQSLCLFGVNLSEAVLGALIAAAPQDIIIATNLDVKHSVGQQAAGKIKRTLDRFFDEGIARIGLPLTKDFADMSPEQHTEWKRTVLLQEPAICSEIALDTNPKTETLDT